MNYESEGRTFESFRARQTSPPLEPSARWARSPANSALAALAGLALAAAPLHAETAITVAAASSRTISYADLDLGSSDGLAALSRRIEAAARELCAAPTLNTASKAEYSCRDATITAAWSLLARPATASGR